MVVLREELVFGTSGGSSDLARADAVAVSAAAAAGDGGKVEVGEEDEPDDRGDGLLSPSPHSPLPTPSFGHVLAEEENRPPSSCSGVSKKAGCWW